MELIDLGHQAAGATVFLEEEDKQAAFSWHLQNSVGCGAERWGTRKPCASISTVDNAHIQRQLDMLPQQQESSAAHTSSHAKTEASAHTFTKERAQNF